MTNGRRCKVCRSEHAAEIDKALISGEKLHVLAEKFGYHTSSLSRHKAHVADKLKAISVFNELREGATLLQKIEALLQRAEALLDKAEVGGDLRVATAAIREVRQTMELLGKASGELAPEKLLVQVAPVIDSLVLILRQEIHDGETLQRVSERIRIAAGSAIDG